MRVGPLIIPSINQYDFYYNMFITLSATIYFSAHVCFVLTEMTKILIKNNVEGYLKTANLSLLYCIRETNNLVMGHESMRSQNIMKMSLVSA